MFDQFVFVTLNLAPLRNDFSIQYQWRPPVQTEKDTCIDLLSSEEMRIHTKLDLN